MANTFYRAIELFENIGAVESSTVWLEIGSERGEGSTLALAGQAQRWGTVLHSVDISDSCYRNVRHPALICHVSRGSDWAKNYGINIDRSISLLHLDNFDCIWDVYNIQKYIRDQIKSYADNFGEIMNNRRCQIEHLLQVLHLQSWLSPDCMVVMDDTYLYNGSWTGKCGAAAVYLEIQGFELVHTDNGGTIMVKGFNKLSRLNHG